MTKLVVLGLLVAAICAVVACGNQETVAADVCGQATHQFATCGTSLPLLTDGPCTGTTKLVARCVVDHAHDCDELATLFARIDTCVGDLLDGGDSLLPPATDLPLPGRDGGRDAGTHVDGAAPPHDAGTDPPVLDAGVDSGPTVPTVWPGLDATGTVTLAQEMHFATPMLPVGTYTFTMTGNGDADLYVHRNTQPTTATYDCRPYLDGSDESCALTLTAPATIQVMIRGETTTSTFTLQGRP